MAKQRDSEKRFKKQILQNAAEKLLTAEVQALRRQTQRDNHKDVLLRHKYQKNLLIYKQQLAQARLDYHGV